MSYKVKCECGWKGEDDELLRARDPFIKGETLVACPKCRDAFELIYVCDEPGCWETRTCGMPTDKGYRETCGKHKPKQVET